MSVGVGREDHVGIITLDRPAASATGETGPPARAVPDCRALTGHIRRSVL